MKAEELKNGMSFRRTASSTAHTIEKVRDLDPDGKAKPILRNKLEITPTIGNPFWMYKNDRVFIVPQKQQ